ncbi:MAG: TlpA family protein disulfide reductase [Chitinophagaceae bacterium]|nr:MAG: TlpA family protein disulfide reductase [Chitinophagaceae bacterium]
MPFCKEKLLFIAIALFIFQLCTRAQEIKIGSVCPDVVLKDILNFQTDEIRFSDLKGKFIILDFWATSCGACIDAFPKLDSLQKKYQERLQIITVTRESKQITSRFFARMKHIKMPSVPFATSDTILSRVFPHMYVPHHVWIDSARIVRYITDGYNATEYHIEQFLKNNDLRLSEKKYEKNYAYNTPIEAIYTKTGIDQLESYSLLMHCLSGITFSNGASNTYGNEKPNRISQNCASIGQLYETAFNENGKHDFSAENTIIYNIKNRSRFVIPKDFNQMDEWKSNYSFNYELMVPETAADKLYQRMQRDLVTHFNVKGVIEKKMVKCLALVSTNRQLLKTKGEKSSTNFWIMSADTVKFMVNQPFSSLVTWLSISRQGKINDMPFIDLTNYKGNMDIQLSTAATATFNIERLRFELKRYGLDLVTTLYPREVLVLSDVD